MDGRSVWGVVYQVSELDLEALDEAEGFRPGRASNSYWRRECVVYLGGDEGRPLTVQTYFAEREPNPPLPSQAYKALILRGARFWRLPDAYIRELEAIPVGQMRTPAIWLSPQGTPSRSYADVLSTSSRARPSEPTRHAARVCGTRKFGKSPSEDEMIAHFVMPLLRALGWPPERIPVKWRHVDVAVFSALTAHIPKLPVRDRGEAFRRGRERRVGTGKGLRDSAPC
ncbi:MAG: gamma-glutamylcyclotransferase [Burkholderiales bacterium]|nr:gamma-glutamylcyclotransferase [Burkholderiales bacterium]